MGKRTISIPSGAKIVKRKNVSAGTKALKEVRKLKSQVEKKYFGIDRTLATTNLEYNSTTGVIHALFEPAKGEDFNERDGYKINAQSINLRCAAYAGANATTSSLRVMLIRSKQRFVPVCTDNASAGLFEHSQLGYYDFFNKDNRQHFEVHYDKVFNFDSASKNMVLFNINKSCKNKPVVFEKSSTATVTAERGQWYLCAISSEATGGGNLPSLGYKGFARYTDI